MMTKRCIVDTPTGSSTDKESPASYLYGERVSGPSITEEASRSLWLKDISGIGVKGYLGQTIQLFTRSFPIPITTSNPPSKDNPLPETPPPQY